MRRMKWSRPWGGERSTHGRPFQPRSSTSEIDRVTRHDYLLPARGRPACRPDEAARKFVDPRPRRNDSRINSLRPRHRSNFRRLIRTATGPAPSGSRSRGGDPIDSEVDDRGWTVVVASIVPAPCLDHFIRRHQDGTMPSSFTSADDGAVERTFMPLRSATELDRAPRKTWYCGFMNAPMTV